MANLDPLADIKPDVPNFSKDIINSIKPGQATYANMEKSVRGLTETPSLIDTILPSIKALLMPGKDNPYTKLIDQSTGVNVAAAQTDAMRRGLTGSDIEAASMVGARGAGETAKAQFFSQNAQQMAGFLKELATGDINSQRENLTMFAQLMGQKIQSDQDLENFRTMLQENMAQAARNNKSSMWGAAIGAAGSIGAGALISDERLKTNQKKVGRAGGLDIFSFRWSKLARAAGAHDGVEVGVLAQDVEAKYPEASIELNGIRAVDYSKLPVEIIEARQRLGAMIGG